MALITPGQSIVRGIGISGIVAAFIAGILIVTSIDWLWWPLSLIIGIAAGGLTFGKILSEGVKKPNLPYGHHGVQTRFGEHGTGNVLSSGTHFGVPGFEDAIKVDTRHKQRNLDKEFMALASDAQDVNVDGFFRYHVVNSIRWQGVEHAEDQLLATFMAKIRLFTTIISKAVNATKFKDLLAEFLKLSRRRPGQPMPPDHLAFKRELENLVASDNALIVPNGIETIMDLDIAGEFCGLVTAFGGALEDVEIEDFDVPAAIKAAAASEAIEQGTVKGYRVRNTARAEMIQELIDKNVDPRTATNSVDMLMGMNVGKTVIEVSDLEKAAQHIGPTVAGALAAFLSSKSNNQSTGQGKSQGQSNKGRKNT